LGQTRNVGDLHCSKGKVRSEGQPRGGEWRGRGQKRKEKRKISNKKKKQIFSIHTKREEAKSRGVTIDVPRIIPRHGEVIIQCEFC